MQPNKVLSKSMQVKPLVGEEYVIYRLLASDTDSPNIVDDQGKPIKCNPVRVLARQTLVQDFETGNKVMIGNVVSHKPIKKEDGSYRYEDVTKSIRFDDGFYRVNADQNATYEYLERHNANASNIFRDRKQPAVYYKVDAKKVAMTLNNKNAMLADALSWVSSADDKEIKAINEFLPIGKKLNMESHFEVIKGELFKITLEDPIMVMKASSNRDAISKIVVMESEYFNIIIWDEQTRKWFFNEEGQEELVTLEIGKNRIGGLVEYFFSGAEGKKCYKRVESRLKKFLNIGNPNR